MNIRKKVKKEVINKCLIIVHDNSNIPRDLYQSCMSSNDTFFEQNFPFVENYLLSEQKYRSCTFIIYALQNY